MIVWIMYVYHSNKWISHRFQWTLYCVLMRHLTHKGTSLIARCVGPTWGPSGADRTQVGPMLAPWTLLNGLLSTISELKDVYCWKLWIKMIKLIWLAIIKTNLLLCLSFLADGYYEKIAVTFLQTYDNCKLYLFFCRIYIFIYIYKFISLLHSVSINLFSSIKSGL